MPRSVKEYWTDLRQTSRSTSLKFGVDLRYASMEVRALAAVTGSMFAVLIKLLVDKGIITDTEVRQAWVAARGEVWDIEPIQPPETPPGSEDPLIGP